MSVFDEDDSQTVRSLAMTFVGFSVLTVALIILATVIT